MNFSGGKLESQGGRSGLPLGGVGSGAQAVQKDLDIILMRTGQTLAAGYLRVMVLPADAPGAGPPGFYGPRRGP